jgi:hypothetical protein
MEHRISGAMICFCRQLKATSGFAYTTLATFEDSRGELNPVCREWLFDKNYVWFSEKYVSLIVVIINFVLVEVVERMLNWVQFTNRNTQSIYKLYI